MPDALVLPDSIAARADALSSAYVDSVPPPVHPRLEQEPAS
jgi:hypothetical protein